MTPDRSPSGPVVAAGLSPAWQTIMRFASLEAGEVNRASEVWRGASGKVLNVAVALATLRGGCRAVTVMGGAAAEWTAVELAGLGIELVAVPIVADARCCTTLLDDATGKTTELLERTPCPAIVDARGPELVAALSCRPLLVKPNREELARTVGHPLGSEVDLRAAMESLRERGAEWVLVTDGAKPAILLGPSGWFHVVPPRPECVINPIGCGDCLAAGIADQIARGRGPLEAIRFGMACASFNCGTLLAGRLDRTAVDRLSGSVEVARIAVAGGKTRS